jgi:hypothetical protein
MKKIISFSVLLFCTTIYAQVPSYVPTNGLVGYWPFNGNANDESGNGNNGVVHEATLAADRMGNGNSAYNFDGISNYISINNSPSLNIIGTQITLSFWLCSNNNSNDANYKGISKGGYDVGSGYEFIYRNSFSGDNGVISITGGTGIQACDVGYNMNSTFGQWIHLAVTLNNGVASFYVNGGYQVGNNLNQISQFVSNNSELLFGKRNPANSNSGYLKGKMDDIGIWNRALTQEEITAMYNGETYSDICNSVSGSLTQGLVGYWPFCGNANDDSGHGNNGTVNGATLTTDRFGNSNSAYDFDGLTSYISGAGVNLPQGDTARTVSLWVKTAGGFSVNTGGQTGAVFDYGTLENNKRFSVLLVDNDFTNYFSAAYNDFHPDSSIGNNVWTNIVWVYSATNLKLYLNGVPSSTGTISNLNTTGQNFVIGNTIPNSIGQYEKYKGAIDDIGIWNRALTPSEISQLYNQNQCFTNTTVTDTLVINVGQLSYTNPIAYANNITIYPNPANTQVNISFNNIIDLTGGQIRIINSLGQQVATTPITLSGTSTTMSLATWGGTGLYFVQILNTQGQILDIKKIILQ